VGPNKEEIDVFRYILRSTVEDSFFDMGIIRNDKLMVKLRFQPFISAYGFENSNLYTHSFQRCFNAITALMLKRNVENRVRA
jgi:hypothetical protein